MQASRLNELFRRVDRPPILVDVGASGSPPAIWAPIARHAVYVGFDPDQRSGKPAAPAGYRQSIIVDQAIVGEPSVDRARFYFTKSPLCSSSLPPATDSLRHYLFADLFAIERQGEVAATTLNEVLAHQGLSRIDWLKADTQGTDLRIFNSLAEPVRSRVLALDVEPGLIDAYAGEDLFADTHRQLTAQGFWLSRLQVRGAVRMQPATLAALTDAVPWFSRRAFERTARPSPAWVEARYLRSLEWLAEHAAGPTEHALLGVFALLDHQPGYALDIVRAAERCYPAHDLPRVLRQLALAEIRRQQRLAPWRRLQRLWRPPWVKVHP
ncbi:FkbM family methyltransferase [bacterium]|nr:FkbM family methyltransferase [bacterium]